MGTRSPAPLRAADKTTLLLRAANYKQLQQREANRLRVLCADLSRMGFAVAGAAARTSAPRRRPARDRARRADAAIARMERVVRSMSAKPGPATARDARLMRAEMILIKLGAKHAS